MSEKIPETYVSPTLRKSFLLEDFPGAKDTYQVVKAQDSGIDPLFWDEAKFFVVCTLTIPGHPEPFVAWKEVPETEWRKTPNGRSKVSVVKTPELLRKLQTMALGRALKDAGYPDDSRDFKLLLLWRQRAREISAAVAPMGELGSGDTDLTRAVDATARRAGETVGDADEIEHGGTNDDDITDAEIVPPGPPPGVDPETGEKIEPPAPAHQAPEPTGEPQASPAMAAFHEAFAKLKGPTRVRLAKDAKTVGILAAASPKNDSEATTLCGFIEAYAEEGVKS